MIDRAALSPVAHFVVALTSVLAAGCACVRHAPTEPVPAAPPAASSPVQPAPAAQVAIPKAPVPVAPATPATPVAPDRQPPKAPAVAVTPAPTPAVVPKAAPAPVVPKAAPAAAVPKAVPAPVVPPPAAAPLDLKSLEARLRQTRAIGMLTKLSLKNQVDDLVEKFRAYHRRQGTTTLADLRRNYDMLFMKVLSLLQDSDPSLARDIVRSRSAIWSILEDPKKFTESKLMAGATP